MTHHLPSLKHLEFGGAKAVPDPALITLIQDLMQQGSVYRWLTEEDIHLKFVDKYREWISHTELNEIQGLSCYPISAASNGTSESFDKFYLKNHRRRFRCFRGEYMYHAASWKNYFPNWRWIDDADIDAQDAVIISYPFSDTGDQHPDMDSTLDQCDRLGVPVLIDCAFFGACAGLCFDFDRECITDIVFSLSKTVPVAHARIGIRFTKTDDDDSLLIHHKTGYLNRMGLGLGLSIMEKISPDQCFRKFADRQRSVCEQLEVEASPTVFLGIDRAGSWKQYNRGTSSNRLCIADRLIEND
jgi:hypothetical protein